MYSKSQMTLQYTLLWQHQIQQSFVAEGVHALIKGSEEGTKTANTLENIEISAHTTEDFESPDWQFVNYPAFS